MITLYPDQKQHEITSPLEQIEDKEVWVYINPLNGLYGVTITLPHRLIIFTSEAAARAVEHKSPTMQGMIGHYMSFKEAVFIAMIRYAGYIIYA